MKTAFCDQMVFCIFFKAVLIRLFCAKNEDGWWWCETRRQMMEQDMESVICQLKERKSYMAARESIL